MYTKPIIFKVYAIILAVSSLLGVILSLLSLLSSNNNFFGYNGISTSVKLLSVFISLLSLFFSCIEYSAMYTFAQMIEHEQSNSISPFKKETFAFSHKFYKGYGTGMFIITLIFSIISMVALIIMVSISGLITTQIILLIIGMFIINAIIVVFAYVNYYLKFHSFGNLLEMLSAKEVTETMKNNLKGNKSNLLRVYCAVLFGIGILILAVSAILAIMMFNVFSISIIISSVVSFISLSIIGCYFDSLAKMVEHNMIKYKLYDDNYLN